MQETILLFNKKEVIVSSLTDGLREAGYEVNVVNSDGKAISFLSENHTDLLIINIGIDVDYYADISLFIEHASKNSEHNPHFPVIILASPSKKDVVVESFNAGAHDVLIKPFRCEELLARIRNLLNIFHLTRERENLPVRVGDLIIEPINHKVMRGETEIFLTSKEFELLLYLAKHADQACSREQILKEVWNYSYHLGTNVVDVYIRHLRKKVDRGHSPKMIHTVRGVGYILKEG
ncbi:response regulator transcription factor [Paenibacillus pini]|uniref:Two-component transcriptional regulator n=1 Tax=Paenibacillus pini JCM 16418 TaxID=1236976 RepID=W7YYJ5_9BACL|nr:response regulator transcription factor [Paenibacillus pini]GAF07524.1 two-component transcriptional regulator [Paenibacillus pini JCM 16418]